MGLLSPYQDMTGTMSPTEINAENIQQLINEANRSSDQLNTLTSAFNVVAYGSHTTTVVTVPPVSNDLSNQFKFSHNLGYIPSYLCYIPGQADSTSTPPSGFSKTYYVALVNTFQTFGNGLTYTWEVGIDTTYFYLSLIIVNNNSSPSYTSVPQTIYFYIFSNPAAGLVT
jgi:hypothetical protein